MQTTVTTSFGPVSYSVTGEGCPVLLLHANPGDRRDWDAVAPALSRNHRVYAIDWPGYGESPAMAPEHWSAFGYAALLGELVARLCDEPAILVGNSVGGFAAAKVALAHPERLAAIVLVDPGGFAELNWFARLFCWLKSKPWIVRRTAGRFTRYYLRARNEHTRAMIARADAQMNNPPQIAVDAAMWRSFLDPAHDLRDEIGAVRVPVQLVWGQRDPIIRCDVEGATARRLLPSAEFVGIDSGHAPFAENPEAFLRAVEPFLAAHAWKLVA
jgi:pimeloyl-ACP methyl ester carboxylesterase